MRLPALMVTLTVWTRVRIRRIRALYGAMIADCLLPGWNRNCTRWRCHYMLAGTDASFTSQSSCHGTAGQARRRPAEPHQQQRNERTNGAGFRLDNFFARQSGRVFWGIGKFSDFYLIDDGLQRAPRYRMHWPRSAFIIWESVVHYTAYFINVVIIISATDHPSINCYFFLGNMKRVDLKLIRENKKNISNVYFFILLFFYGLCGECTFDFIF